MTDAAAHMWYYWKDKMGSPSEALEAYYPELLKSNIRLREAFAMVQNGQALIDLIMKEMEDDGNE